MTETATEPKVSQSDSPPRTPSVKSVQREAERIFRDILMKDDRLQLPQDLAQFAPSTTFDSSAQQHPVLPCPLKMTETSAALWAMLGTVSNLICNMRYGIGQLVTINTDVATLFLISSGLVRVDGKTLQEPALARRYLKYDLGRTSESFRRFATNIYPTKDGRWFHLHGSMNATPILTMLGLDTSRPDLDETAAIDLYGKTVSQWNSKDIDYEANTKFHQAGTICLTPEEFLTSEQGQATAEDGLYLLEKMSASTTPPIRWPRLSPSNTYRPLEGVKMLDLSRVIAAPTIAKLAALFGATVIRVSCSKNPDMGSLLIDGNLGKRDVDLDLKTPEGKQTLETLIADCDVFLDGYRPGAMERLGFGPEAVRAIAEKASNKGIVYVRENCYGWKGPMANRSGWQQISDCVTGASYLQGRFFGLEEPVVPIVPNSDYQTGLLGLIGIMAALLRREKEGGSYLLSVALNYYNRFLLSLGEQPEEYQAELKLKYKDLKFRHFDDMTRLVIGTMKSMVTVSPQIFRPQYFSSIKGRLGGEKDEVVTFVGPAAQFEKTQLGYDVGPSFVGEDEARWP